MLEVAPPVAIGIWDKPWAWSSNHGLPGCMPLESQHGGPYMNLQSFWKSIAPRNRESSAGRGSMRPPVRPSFELSVQPAVTKPRKRKKSAPRSQDSRRTPEPGPSAQQRLHRLNDAACSQPVDTIEQPAACPAPVLGNNTTITSAEPLFSSIASQSGQPYEPKNLCDLCRQPFEAEEDALYKHLSQHWAELVGSLSCDKCQTLFSHKGDLDWHLKFAEHGDVAYDTSRINLVRLRKWEQAQLRLHSQTIDRLLLRRSRQSSARSSSVPPRERKPFESDLHVTDNKSSEYVIDDEPSDAVHSPSLRVVMDSELNARNVRLPPHDSTDRRAAPQEHATIYSLQQRIRDLMEQFQPSTPNEQTTPYSEFCDSHSLPGSPDQLSKDGPETKADRATSEPPLHTSRAGDSIQQAAPHYANGNAQGNSGTVWNAASPGQGQKRGSDGRDFGQWEEDDGNGNGLQPKKRKTANGNVTEAEKRFPCIFHIGEPVEFKNDVARHRHISNMCRHLRSHNFYSCSTCITRMPSNEELERHIGQHVKACAKRGCKRTKPAGYFADPINCSHIMSAEDQWRELFVLQFKRQPPNVFDSGSRAPPHVIDSVGITRDANIMSDPPMQYSLDTRNASVVDYGLTESFFEQAMEFDLRLPPNNLQSDTAPLDMDEFLALEPAQDLQDPNQTGAGAEATDSGDTPVEHENEQPSGPMQDVVASLQQQVTALESMISTQTTKDRDRLFSLQENVVQLEQKLFQSSERERQLEATLEVIFDAFQASGAPQAQPNKPLWNLVKSHSSQVIGSVTSGSRSRETLPSSSFLSMSPSLTFSTETKVSARTPPDSAYGSVR